MYSIECSASSLMNNISQIQSAKKNYQKINIVLHTKRLTEALHTITHATLQLQMSFLTDKMTSELWQFSIN